MELRLTDNLEEALAIRKRIEAAIEAKEVAPDPTREERIAELIADSFVMTREEAEWFIDGKHRPLSL